MRRLSIGRYCTLREAAASELALLCSRHTGGHALPLQIYLQYLAAWRGRTGQPLTHFVHCDRWSMWGRWGAKEYPSQTRAQVRQVCCIAAAAVAVAGAKERHFQIPAGELHLPMLSGTATALPPLQAPKLDALLQYAAASPLDL